MVAEYDFGVLDPALAAIEFDGVRASAVMDRTEFAEFAAADVHKDGWFYPPVFTQHTRPAIWSKDEPEPDWEPVANTTRPAHLFRMFATHRLLVPDADPADERRTMASLALRLMSFVLGTKLQFADWWHDTRIRIKREPPFHASNKEAASFLRHAWIEAKKLSAENRDLLLRILHLFVRTPSYEWEWERFAWNYAVADGCWRFLVNTGRISLPKTKTGKPKEPGHAARIEEMCKAFAIPDDEQRRDQIVDLRSNLIHEVTWDNGIPGQGSSREAFSATLNFESLVARIVTGCLGVPCGFVRTRWTSRSRFALDLQLLP